MIFVFLRSPSATLIPSLSVPLSLVGTLAFMYLAGFSLNNLSLMALTIATGFVVDDAIVMIENISRYIEAGDPPLQAALKGSAQIGFTIISLTVSLIAVLIPLLFMPDVVGRLFREFAITLAVTIVISAVVALTLVPMMCAKILRHQRAVRDVADRAQEPGMVRSADRPIRPGVELGARPSAADPAGGGRDPGADGVSLHRDPEGLFPGAGHRADPGDFGRLAIGVLRGDVRAPAGAGRRHPRRSRCRQPDLVHRRRRHQYDAQQRPVSDQPETARSAPAFGERCHSPAAARGVACRRDHSLHAAGAGSDDRRDGQPLAIPIRARRRQRRGIRKLGPEADAASRPDPADRGCRQHLFRQWPLGLCQYRPRDRGALWHHSGNRRQCALRLVRTAHRLDNLYPIEPIPGDPRSRPQ